MPLLVAATALDVAADVWHHVPQWTVPCLVVHGAADTSTDPRQSRRFVDLLPVEDKTLHLVDGGYHEVLHDIDGDEVLALVLSWLDARTHG